MNVSHNPNAFPHTNFAEAHNVAGNLDAAESLLHQAETRASAQRNVAALIRIASTILELDLGRAWATRVLNRAVDVAVDTSEHRAIAEFMARHGIGDAHDVAEYAAVVAETFADLVEAAHLFHGWFDDSARASNLIEKAAEYVEGPWDWQTLADAACEFGYFYHARIYGERAHPDAVDGTSRYRRARRSCSPRVPLNFDR